MIITDRKLGGLALVAAIMLVVTVILYSGGYAPQADFQKGALLIQGLDPAKVATVKLNQGGQTVTLLANQKKGFVIQERDNYPASTEKVRKLLLECLGVTCAEKITEAVKNHAALQVLADSSNGITIRFLDGGGKTQSGLVIGKYAEHGIGTYVRRLDQDAVYVSSRPLSVSVKPTAYMKTSFFDFNEPEIAEVRVDRKGEKYTLSRDDQGEIKIKNPPPGKRGKDYELKTIFRSLGDLAFRDVLPTGKKKITWDNTVDFSLKSGATYNLRVGTDANQEYYLQLQAITPEGNLEIAKNATEKEIKAKEARVAILTAANKFNQLHHGWDYKISKWTARKICKPLDDILEKAPEKSEQPAAKAATATAPAENPATTNKPGKK